MIEEELFRLVLVIFSSLLILVIGFKIIFSFMESNEKMKFYENVKELVSKMASLKKFYPPSYDSIRIKVPKGCKLRINEERDYVEVICDRNFKISLAELGIDVIKVVGGKNCEIGNGTIKEGEYKITLAYVERLPEKLKECVIYYD